MNRVNCPEADVSGKRGKRSGNSAKKEPIFACSFPDEVSFDKLLMMAPVSFYDRILFDFKPDVSIQKGESK